MLKRVSYSISLPTVRQTRRFSHACGSLRRLPLLHDLGPSDGTSSHCGITTSLEKTGKGRGGRLVSGGGCLPGLSSFAPCSHIFASRIVLPGHSSPCSFFRSAYFFWGGGDQPFVDDDHPLQNFFPPREWAIRIPVILILLGSAVVGSFLSFVMIRSNRKRAAKAKAVAKKKV